MMRLILIAALLAGPVAAETVSINASGTAWVELEPGSGSHVAAVTFQNRLIDCPSWCSGHDSFQLVAGDIVVTVILDHARGRTPDMMTVIPPQGYIAIPDHVLVDEDAQGVIRIFEEGLS